MRLIDANALHARFKEVPFGSLSSDELSFVLKLYDMINTTPAVDAEPVRHGRWIEADYVYFGAKRYICNQCKDDEYWKLRYSNYKEKYCPNCGAKMDGE